MMHLSVGLGLWLDLLRSMCCIEKLVLLALGPVNVFIIAFVIFAQFVAEKVVFTCKWNFEKFLNRGQDT